jgi:hypothetical protein
MIPPVFSTKDGSPNGFSLENTCGNPFTNPVTEVSTVAPEIDVNKHAGILTTSEDENVVPSHLAQYKKSTEAENLSLL